MLPAAGRKHPALLRDGEKVFPKRGRSGATRSPKTAGGWTGSCGARAGSTTSHRQAAPHPTGRHQSGAGLLPAAGRRARARHETGEEQINRQRHSKLPQVTRLLGSASLPQTQAFLRRSWIYEIDPRSVSSTPARRAACDSSSPSGRLPPCGPPAQNSKPYENQPMRPCLRWARHPCPSLAARSVPPSRGSAHPPSCRMVSKLNNLSREKYP